MRNTSVRTRLALWNVGVLALILGALGLAIHVRARADLLAGVDRDLMLRSRRLIGVGAAWRGVPATDTFLADAPLVRLAPTPFRPRVFDRSSGRSVSQFEGDAPWLPLDQPGARVYQTVTPPGEVPLRVLSRVVGKGRVVHHAYPLAETYRALAGLTRTLLTFIPIGLLAAAGGGAFLTDRALRPVRQVTQTASRIGAARDLEQRLPVPPGGGGDEFARLAATFNGMLERLERAFARQRRFTGDASHELRTPLTIIKANASLALSDERLDAEQQQSLVAIDRAADTMNRLVGDLLILARGDDGRLARNSVAVPLGVVLDRAAQSVRRPDAAPITVRVAADAAAAAGDELAAWGDAHELQRVFTNLLENAARHTPPAGQITVNAWPEENARAVVVTVADTGEGIAPEHLPHLGERFYRVDPSRTGGGSGGTGLGLSIVRGIVDAHHGDLNIQSTLGAGTTITITLPCADQKEAQ